MYQEIALAFASSPLHLFSQRQTLAGQSCRINGFSRVMNITLLKAMTKPIMIGATIKKQSQ